MKILWAEAENRTPCCHSILVMLCVLCPWKVLSTMLGMDRNVEGGTTQIAEFLTLCVCSQSLPGGSQTLCTLLCSHIQWGAAATGDFHHCPYTPPHLHQVISQVHLPLLFEPPGQIKSPPPPLAPQSRAHSPSLIPLTHGWILVSPHTPKGRGCQLPLPWSCSATTEASVSWQLQETLKSLRFYRLGRQQKGNSYSKIQITPTQINNKIPRGQLYFIK